MRPWHIYDVDIAKYVKVPIPNEGLINKISAIAHKAEQKKETAIRKVRNLISDYEREIET